jgi:hypothetical protein
MGGKKMSAIYDVTEAFDGLMWDAILHRGSTGQYVDGVWISDTSLDATIRVHIQPINDGTDIELIPDGFRDKEIVEVWSEEKLIPYSKEGQRVSDVIQDDSGRYRILTCKDWKKIGGYYRSLAVKEI